MITFVGAGHKTRRSRFQFNFIVHDRTMRREGGSASLPHQVCLTGFSWPCLQNLTSFQAENAFLAGLWIRNGMRRPAWMLKSSTRQKGCWAMCVLHRQSPIDPALTLHQIKRRVHAEIPNAALWLSLVQDQAPMQIGRFITPQAFSPRFMLSPAWRLFFLAYVKGSALEHGSV